MSLLRIEIDQRPIGLIVYLDQPDADDFAEADALVATVAETLGCSLQDARLACIAVLAERLAEDRAYRGACDRLGVLL